MSPAVLALSVCTFALGFAEFVAVSLVPSIARGTGLDVAHVGLMVGIYAIGVSVGAPVLSAALATKSRRPILAASMLLFAVSNILTALSSSLAGLLASRFSAGLMHGVVLALAASTAAQTAKDGQAGKAIASVFGGLTLALVIGVPLGTLAGGHLEWQHVFMAVAVIGALGSAGLALFAPSVTNTGAGVAASIRATVLDRATLHRVLITLLTYAGSFTGFTYISVLLEQVTHLSGSGVTAMFLLYGVSAAVGNAMGGKLVDRVGSRVGTLVVIAGLAASLVSGLVAPTQVWLMTLAMGVWGLSSFAAVPVLQKTVLVAAQSNPQASAELASGMNIAAFNIGIALGAVFGGWAGSLSPVLPMAAGLSPLVLATLAAVLLDRRRTTQISTPVPFNH